MAHQAAFDGPIFWQVWVTQRKVKSYLFWQENHKKKEEVSEEPTEEPSEGD